MSPEARFKATQPMCRLWAGTEYFTAALEGLWQACLSWSEVGGKTFRGWAYLKINASVAEAQRAASPVPRRMRERGVANPGELFDWMALSRFPTPEEYLLRKEAIVAVRRELARADGLEGALLRASLLGERHDEWAARRGVSKSWASRINTRAEKRLSIRLREHCPR